MKILSRHPSEASVNDLMAQGQHPVLARLYAARGVNSLSETEHQLAGLLPFAGPLGLKGVERMAELLYLNIAQGRRMAIVADYDSDGATACAVGVRGLRMLGAQVEYLVPNRFEYGYGLTPEIVDLAIRTLAPEVIITVDNGIASVAGVQHARDQGLQVLVTDHHLPGDELPAADCIVNPNQPGCAFPSKHIAGVGVMFYVLLALRAHMRAQGCFEKQKEPNLGSLLDLVALGTVADVVKLDQNNRTLVHHGMERMRNGQGKPGIRALLTAANRDVERLVAADLGFYVGPRLNAAGRIDDMKIGIECLLADDMATAQSLAIRLDALNKERKHIEQGMQEQANQLLEGLDVGRSQSITLFRQDWHQGVIGILASRIKDRYTRPTIVFADGGDGLIKGSGRSVSGLHLRDTLDLVAKRHPGMLIKFGGHAAAAGLTILARDFERFAAAFERAAGELMESDSLEESIEVDGELSWHDISLDTAKLLRRQVWGQGFPEPLFCDEFTVLSQRVLGEKHLKLKVAKEGVEFDAILFNRSDLLPDTATLTYRLDCNVFRNQENLQLMIDRYIDAPELTLKPVAGLRG